MDSSARAARQGLPVDPRSVASRSRAAAAISAQMKADRRLGARRRRRPRSPACTSRCCSKSRRCARDRPSRSRFASWAATRCTCPAEFAEGTREPLQDIARNLERWVARAGHSHVRAGEGGDAGGGAGRAARHQRADRRRASLPGARRRVHAARAVGRLPRPHNRVRRRRQQRRDVARAGGVHARRHRARGVPAGYELPDSRRR